MSEFQSSNFKKENGGTPDLLGKTELTSPYFFVPPSGDTASRPESCAAGTLRFNTDIGTLEIFKGDTIGWEQIQRRESQYLGGAPASNNPLGGIGTRALFFGRAEPSITNRTDFFTISTLGRAQDFGDTNHSGFIYAGDGATASQTRGFHIDGGAPANPGGVTDIAQINMLHKGNAFAFGDLNYAATTGGFVSNCHGGL